MERLLIDCYLEVSYNYNPTYISCEHSEVNELYENMSMKDGYKNIIPKPSKEEYMSLITPIFKTKMINAIRIKRNELLLNSDWTQIPDVELTNKNEWKTYRKLLRDLPANINIEFGKEIEDYFPSSPM